MLDRLANAFLDAFDAFLQRLAGGRLFFGGRPDVDGIDGRPRDDQRCQNQSDAVTSLANHHGLLLNRLLLLVRLVGHNCVG